MVRRVLGRRRAAVPVWQVSPSAFGEGATSIDGFWSKNPNGFSQNEIVSTGMIGHSSTRVMWWRPKTYQSTTSAFSSGASSLIHSVRPVSTVDCVGYLPHGQRSSSSCRVTHRVWPMTGARRYCGVEGSIMAGNAAPGTSL